MIPRATTGATKMDTVPWYRQPWPWFVIALPAVAVVASIASAVLAVRSADEPVEADYYRRGLEINAELARRDRAAQLGLSVELVTSGLRANDRVVLHVAGQQALPPDATVQLRLVVPGHPEGERRLLLARVPGSNDPGEASFEGSWPDDVAAAGAHEVLRWSAESSTWFVDGDADWRGGVARPQGAARAAAH